MFGLVERSRLHYKRKGYAKASLPEKEFKWSANSYLKYNINTVEQGVEKYVISSKLVKIL